MTSSHRRPGRRDHPRVCGENPTTAPRCCVSGGSPPRMRGEHYLLHPHRGHRRITPAYAGRTHSTRSRPAAVPDHPRVCGENRPGHSDPPPDGGSPPRMRGEQSVPSGPPTPTADHPRVCGENELPQPDSVPPSGSPPRMRGELPHQNSRRTQMRITPAYAGRTTRLWVCPGWKRDHPRVCGENLRHRREHLRILGSPPRMRGEQALPDPDRDLVGITPAYAGRTDIARGPWSRVKGSPPRMRGEPCLPPHPAPLPGITPAYAGRTPTQLVVSHQITDHPRVCGENLLGSGGSAMP